MYHGEVILLNVMTFKGQQISLAFEGAEGNGTLCAASQKELTIMKPHCELTT